MDPISSGPQPATIASEAIPAHRAAFIRRTYAHLGGALLAFALLEIAIFQTNIPESVVALLGTSQFSWLIVMGAFMGVSWLAHMWAESDASVELQYAGLATYVIAESIIFIPMLWMTAEYAGVATIQSAALLTLMLFTGLTVAVFATQHDFSWMGSVLCVGGFVALGLIICSVLFGFQLGVLFSGAMILFAAGCILYDTSNILLHYRTDQHVAASLSLFASVALLFWYILRLFMNLKADD
jgi:FtsH-binding integral membrane protein